MKLGYSVIDLHTHLRNDIPRHTRIAKENGIDAVVYMANCEPPLDNLERIKESLNEKRYCKAIPASAITKNLEGEELVDVDRIRPYVAGFSDDGRCLNSLDLFSEILQKGVLVMVHCEPETETIKSYLDVLEKLDGKLHIQHISRKESVEIIRKAKQQGMRITCETCPHYFTYTEDDIDLKVNLPLATEQDIIAIKEGLADGTIDVIASDYAPKPRKTGIAGFRSFIPLSYGLVLKYILSEKQLKEKLFTNPRRIIESGGYDLEI